MLYSDMKIRFEEIPKEFTLKISKAPEVRDGFLIYNKDFAEHINAPLIEQVRGFEYSPSMALIVRDVLHFHQFDPDSKVHSDSTPERREKSISYALSYYSEEDQERLKQLKGLDYGADLSDKAVPFDSLERQVMLYSEKDYNRQHYTVNFGCMGSFFIHLRQTPEVGEAEMFHKKAYDFEELMKSHDWFSRNDRQPIRGFIEYPDIVQRALDHFALVRKHARKVHSLR